ncbi:MAG: ribokinase [Armatimonadetes bacterium]|jgi:ribokinase|nr:ribokinase [Armatimonadota bacterium]NLN89407.1 ribokinase [candidate division WS1 bacterium]
MAARIAVIGNINCDFVFRVPRLPRPGETLAGSAFFTAAGGKGANQAVAAARLGAQVSFVGCVGADTTGADMLSHLGADGVDISRVRTDPKEATGSALIMVQDSGENSIVVAFGANLAIGPEHLAEHRELLQNCDALMLQQEMRIETVSEAIRIGKEAGCRVILDPAPAREDLPAAWREVDVLSPNETEAESILNSLGLDAPSDLEAAAALLRRQGPKAVALKAAARGSFVADGAGAVAVPSFPVEAVDSTAAGDAYTAGLAVALCEGASLVEAARFGNACGALAATRMGAQPSMPTRAEVEKLLG